MEFSRLLRAVPFPLPFAAASLIGLVGCDESTPDPEAFDPRGTSAELYGEWDVNALVPSADVCSRAGIDAVEVVFSSADDAEQFTSPEFRFPCATGYFDSAGPMLRAGALGYRWRALAGEEVVLESRRYSATVVDGEELVLMPVDFVRRIGVQIDLTLTWATGVGFGSCAEAFVDTMNWELRRETSTGALVAASNGDLACAGSVSIPDLPTGILEAGDYVVVVHGDASDGAAWGTECSVVVFESGAVEATCAVSSTP